MALPIVLRSNEYAVASSSARQARPVAAAATGGLWLNFKTFSKIKNSPSIVKSGHGIKETGALLANHVLLGHADILKADAARVGALLAHVDLLAPGGDALPLALDDETGKGL